MGEEVAPKKVTWKLNPLCVATGIEINYSRFEEPDDFQNFTRLNMFMFDQLLELVRPYITKQNTNMREAISAEQRLGATLDFLASGMTYERLKFSTRIAPNTLGILIPETLKAIVKTLEDDYLKAPKGPEEWELVADQFHTQWQFPHCIGALDGKHVSFRPLRSSGSYYRNYKHGDSIILMALVDAHYRFLYIDVGKNGRCHDSSVFQACTLGQAIYKKRLPLPKPSVLPGCSIPMPYVIVADDAFSLKENIMKPYSERNLSHDRRVFNYRLSRARRVSENTFGIMTNRFQILLKPVKLSAEKVELIVMAICCLHNFLIARNPERYLSPGTETGKDQNGDDLPRLRNITRQGVNRYTDYASRVRDEFKMYFNTNGRVQWQDDQVNAANW